MVAERAIVVLESPNAARGISCPFPSKGDIDGLKAGDQVIIQGEASIPPEPNDDIPVGLCKLRKK